jgi:glucose/arabinose dehydrogenase
MEQPAHHWLPSIGTSGLAFYDGDLFPDWRGDAFVGGLSGQHLARVVMEGTRVLSTEKLLDGWGRRIRDVRSGPDGYLYILTDEEDGGVYRLEPAA